MIYRDTISREEARRFIGMSGDAPPHCDANVCHAPGECVWCDETPGWQQKRVDANQAFTGHKPIKGQKPCPSDKRRGLGGAHVWGGNIPVREEQ